ncbi:MAG: tetratricopeptide repeat protein [Telluria sp.]
MSILSIMYLNGEGVPRDVQKAIDYATKAYEKGDNGGLSLLGTIYLSPKTGVRDKEKALQFFRTGAEKGEVNSLIHLADMLVQGVEVPQDFEMAFKYYDKAANRHDSITAAHRLGVMYEHGIGRPVDEVKALKWYESVRDVTVRPVPPQVAGIYVRQAALKARNPRRSRDLPEALLLLQEAARAGNGEAMHRLGKLYETGHGVPQNYLSAALMYEQAADAGEAGAMYSGALLFEKGLGVKQSSKEAMSWFLAAAEAGHPAASERMGQAYDAGITVELSHTTAASWYCNAVIKNAALIANPVLSVRELAPQAIRPVAEQLAILDQCAFAAWKTKIGEARAILNRQLTPAIQLEADRLTRRMRDTKNISKVLASKN